MEDGKEIMKFKAEFWKTLASIEENYAKELKKLVESQIAKFESNVLVKFLMSKVTNNNNKVSNISPSFEKTWNQIKNQIQDRSIIHQNFAKEITNEILNPITQFMDKKDTEFKQVIKITKKFFFFFFFDKIRQIFIFLF